MKIGEIVLTDCVFMYLMHYGMVGNEDCKWKRNG